MSLKHLAYIALALTGLVWSWMHGVQWIIEGGNILNLPSFFIDSYKSGSAAAFLTIDIAIVWGVYMIWVVGDAIKIGLGPKTGWMFLALSCLGTCFAFPLYLVVRERHLAKSAATT
jgi:Terpene cyclase DEP1